MANKNNHPILYSPPTHTQDILSPDLLYETPEMEYTFVFKQHPNLGYPPRFHSSAEVYYVKEGSIIAYINNNTYTVNKGEIIVVNPFEIHKYEKTGEAFVSVFIFDIFFLENFKKLYKEKILPTYLTNIEYNRDIFDTLSEIKTSNKSNTILSPLAKQAYVNFFLDKIIKYYGVTDKTISNENIINIISYIYKNYKNQISLDILADEFHYTKTSISRLISKYLKTDLRKFVNDIRAEQAQSMMQDPKYDNISIINIASSCGFDSIATFYRSYKRRFNKLPNRKNNNQ